MVAAIIQARMGSTRFPGKVLKELNGFSLLEYLVKRIQKSEEINDIIIATTNKEEDEKIAEISRKLDVKIFKGSEDDVLSRYYLAAQETKSNVIIRITGDCPLVDAGIVDQLIRKFKENNYDYLSNTIEPTFPDGLDVEVFTKEILKEAYINCEDPKMREHVTPWMKLHKKYRKYSYKNEKNYSHLRVTIDEPEDLLVLKSITEYFSDNIYFNFSDLVELYKKSPDLFLKNNKFKRNEGEVLSKGNKLWRKAKRIIPGGNMLLS